MKFKALEASEKVSKTPNNDLDADGETHLLKGDDQEHLTITVSSIKSVDDSQNEIVSPLCNTKTIAITESVFLLRHVLNSLNHCVDYSKPPNYRL